MDLNLDKIENKPNLNVRKTKHVDKLTSISYISVIIGLIISLITNGYMYYTYIINSQLSTNPFGNIIVSFFGYWACSFCVLYAIFDKHDIKRLWIRILIIFVSIWIVLLTYLGATLNITAVTENKIYYSSSKMLGKVVEYNFKEIKSVMFGEYYNYYSDKYELKMYLNTTDNYIEIASLHDNINNSDYPSIEELRHIYVNIKDDSPNIEIINNVEQGHSYLADNIRYITK